ncbi:RING/U-box superfamily protein [Quillaja saponaria]|uniref:RING/U-box superfamily protein n=1 Tax=Quillaja saponaria TaxID=32244 RepID=A0AAD7KP54_QUISA|nr:RING/U-box superfamily protein [Quillaja saponaria]
MVPHEPYWRTNTSFSPPPSRWDFRFQPEGPPHGLHDGTQLHGSSTSSSTSSEESRSLGPQWTPPAIQEISADDYETSIRRDPSLGRISFTPTKEGTSENPASGGSTSSHSDEFGAVIPLRDAQRWSSASSNFDFRDASESFDTEISGCSHTPSVGYRCGLCERFLSQRSPWGSCRIVRSGDMPISGVLSCCHVFHAECLEQITPKTRKNDPPCPLCIRFEEENSPDQKSLMRLRNGFPRLRPHCEDGPSRPWGCSQASDCVEGALHASPRNAMLLLNRNRIKKNLSLKGNLRKEFPGKLKKSGSYSSQLFVGKSVDQGTVGCSKGTAGPSTQR